ncbi:MAG: glycosyltransferase family 4 protein [Fibrobacter sp.]|jgi:glycosyltransferase involved in cell wall biosynthesis|nr:glycosyltransferase family 4 protein [Fibrobacter sp.]
MRVCMVAYTFYEPDNRVRRYAETLVRRGDKVDAIVLRQPGQQTRTVVSGVNVYKIQGRKLNEKMKIQYLLKLLLFLFKSACKLTQLHWKKKYDVIHVHSVPDFEVFATLFAKLTGAKVILDIHDIVPELFAGKFKAGKDSLFFKLLLWVEKISMAFADHVIVANHIWFQRLIERSVAPEKCSVVMNYPDPSIFTIRKQNSGTSDRFVMIYPGTLSIHQGLETAIRAVDLIKNEIPDLEFHIYGKGTDEEYFVKLVHKMKLENRVFFRSVVPIEMLPRLMADADLGVEPKLKRSFGNEAFSTKILEFMTVGIPVIASDTMVHTHYFDESMVKFFRSEDEDDLARCIVLLRKEEKLRRNLVKNAFKYIEKNSWNIKKYSYLNIVDSL